MIAYNMLHRVKDCLNGVIKVSCVASAGIIEINCSITASLR